MIRFESKFPPLMKYLYYSILVTILDVAVVWLLYRYFNINIVISNTVGVVAGFLLHYILASKSVFNSEYGILGFIIYLGTFLFGLAMANGLIYLGKYYLFCSLSVNINFLFSKGLSIVAPFFVLYYLRKFLYGLIRVEKYEDVNYGKH